MGLLGSIPAIELRQFQESSVILGTLGGSLGNGGGSPCQSCHFLSPICPVPPSRTQNCPLLIFSAPSPLEPYASGRSFDCGLPAGAAYSALQGLQSFMACSPQLGQAVPTKAGVGSRCETGFICIQIFNEDTPAMSIYCEHILNDCEHQDVYELSLPLSMAVLDDPLPQPVLRVRDLSWE